MPNWRDFGDTDKKTFVAALAGTPLAKEDGALFDATTPHRRLFLAQAAIEDRFAQDPLPESFNVRGPRPKSGAGGFVSFGSYTNCARYWLDKLTDPTFVYATTTTVEEYVHTYAPAKDGNNESEYVERIMSETAKYPKVATAPVPTVLTFGNVKHPVYVDRLIPDWQTSAWDDLGQRKPVGVCQHSMDGTLLGTDDYFRRGGESTGLTDYGIGGDTDGANLDGVIYRWNDPLGARHTVKYDDVAGEVSENRAGWANGGTDGLEGDGPLFVRTFGVAGVNRDLVSIERSDGGDILHPVSTKQMASIVGLSAHWFDFARVPYTTYPLNPAYNAVTHLLHKEFATKDCAFPPVNDRIDEIQDAIRGRLKAGQTHTEGTPIPPVVPPKPDHNAYPYGWTADALKKQFGQIEHHWPDGHITKSSWSPRGDISNAWVARAAKDGITAIDKIPKPLGYYDLQAGPAGSALTATIVVFGLGWSLYRPAPGIVWRWVA